MNYQKIILTALIAAVVVSGGAVPVAAQDGDAPTESVEFYGTTTDGSNSASGGTTIVAVALDESGSPTGTTKTIDTNSDGSFGSSDPTGSKLRIDSNAGQQVRFHVGSADGPQSSNTYPLTVRDDNQPREVDLTFPSGTFSDDSDDDEEDEDETDTSGGGSSPGGGAGGADDGAADDDAPPTVQEVQDTLNLVDPTADVSSDIADGDPDTPGLSVSPEGTESVRNINFNNEELTGTVNVREYNDPPQTIRDQVSESVADQVEGLAGDDGGADNINVVSVSDITVESDDSLSDTSATVTLAVDRENVDNPDQLVVVKETFNEEAQTERWAQLDTEIAETTDEEVVLESQVESFSLFAVAEVDQPDGEEQVEDDTADDGTEEPTDDGGPGPAVIIGVLVVLAAAGAAVYVFSQQGE